MMTDESGTIVWQADYLPFGEVNVAIDVVGNGFRFAGQYYDAETGLHYNYHRYYDPKTGRFLTPDPIGLAGIDPSLYGYVLNDPINMIDPWGLLVTYHGVGTSAGAGLGTEGDSVNYMSASGYVYKGSSRYGGSEQGVAGTIGGGRMALGAAGMGYEGGFFFGDVEDFSGKATSVGFIFLIFNIEATFDPCDNSWTGMNFGIFKSLGLGVYAEETTTGRIPTRTWGK